jgi:hypothetical protein
VARSGFVCKFVVGKKNGPRASVWRVWAGRKKPDLYIAATSVAGKVKASLHASGIRHVGLTSQYAASTQQTEKRNIQRWVGGHAIGGGCSLELQICFPTSQLRNFGNADAVASEVIWLAAAPVGMMVRVCIVLGPDDSRSGWPGRNNSGSFLIAEGRLSDLRRVWVVGQNMSDAMFVNENFARRHMSEISSNMRENQISSDEQHRVVAIFRDELNIRGLAEFAGDSFIKLNQ